MHILLHAKCKTHDCKREGQFQADYETSGKESPEEGLNFLRFILLLISMKCLSLLHLSSFHSDSWTNLVTSGSFNDFHLCELKAATSELAVHHQAPLAFLILTEPKHFHGPEKLCCGELHDSRVSIPCTEGDYFRGTDLKLPEAWEKIKRGVKVPETRESGLRHRSHLPHFIFDPHIVTGLV